MKRTLRALFVVFGSAMLLLGPAEAFAGGKKGKGRDKETIRNVHACLDVDDYSIRVAFRVHGMGRYKRGIDVFAKVAGVAQCAPICQDRTVCNDDCAGQMGCQPVCITEPACVTNPLAFGETTTDGCVAKRRHGNWFTAELPLMPLGPALCDGFSTYETVEAAQLVIDDEIFLVDQLPVCGGH